MEQLRKHAILTAIAAVLGIALVYWVRPETTGGVTFLVGLCVVIVNAVGAFVLLVARLFAKSVHDR